MLLEIFFELANVVIHVDKLTVIEGIHAYLVTFSEGHLPRPQTYRLCM